MKRVEDQNQRRSLVSNAGEAERSAAGEVKHGAVLPLGEKVEPEAQTAQERHWAVGNSMLANNTSIGKHATRKADSTPTRAPKSRRPSM